MRRGSLFWGLVIVFAGIVLLLNSLNILAVNFWQLIWPFMLIAAGVYFLLGPTLFKAEYKEELVSIPVDGASEAEIELHHGAGRLEIASLEDPSLLISGSCVGGVEKSISRVGQNLRVRLSSSAAFMWGFPARVDPEGLRWRLNLTRSIPLRLDLKTGASESIVDLTNLNVVEVKIHTGASATTLNLPANAGYTKVKAESGMASLKIVIPQGVAARIQSNSGLSTISVDTLRFSAVNSGFESTDYATATNKVEIFIQSGMGTVEIH